MYCGNLQVEHVQLKPVGSLQKASWWRRCNSASSGCILYMAGEEATECLWQHCSCQAATATTDTQKQHQHQDPHTYARKPATSCQQRSKTCQCSTFCNMHDCAKQAVKTIMLLFYSIQQGNIFTHLIQKAQFPSMHQAKSSIHAQTASVNQRIPKLPVPLCLD